MWRGVALLVILVQFLWIVKEGSVSDLENYSCVLSIETWVTSVVSSSYCKLEEVDNWMSNIEISLLHISSILLNKCNSCLELVTIGEVCVGPSTFNIAVGCCGNFIRVVGIKVRGNEEVAGLSLPDS